MDFTTTIIETSIHYRWIYYVQVSCLRFTIILKTVITANVSWLACADNSGKLICDILIYREKCQFHNHQVLKIILFFSAHRCKLTSGHREWANVVGPQWARKGLQPYQQEEVSADGCSRGTECPGNHIRCVIDFFSVLLCFCIRNQWDIVSVTMPQTKNRSRVPTPLPSKFQTVFFFPSATHHACCIDANKLFTVVNFIV